MTIINYYNIITFKLHKVIKFLFRLQFSCPLSHADQNLKVELSLGDNKPDTIKINTQSFRNIKKT